ncbi:hypothetical protein OS493_014562 [Desmophyllum pertusum]|uniref:Uncharacterized protein n=1 Tax=Desmophyllum pertusum TaxID=174260 RepID=A0A9W9YPQ4_9CNID|nr:hypothetical protein OS493_014562 [Desmophyllum pertusum]
MNEIISTQDWTTVPGSVSGDVNQIQAIERKSYSTQWPRGYGSDSGGGNTVGLLKQVYNRFGVVTSFTGTYKANKWIIQELTKLLRQLIEEQHSQEKRITGARETREKPEKSVSGSVLCVCVRV